MKRRLYGTYVYPPKLTTPMSSFMRRRRIQNDFVFFEYLNGSDRYQFFLLTARIRCGIFVAECTL